MRLLTFPIISITISLVGKISSKAEKISCNKFQIEEKEEETRWRTEQVQVHV